ATSTRPSSWLERRPSHGLSNGFSRTSVVESRAGRFSRTGSGSSFGSPARRRCVSPAPSPVSLLFGSSDRGGRELDGAALELLLALLRGLLAELDGAGAGYSGKSEMLTASEPSALKRSAARRLRSGSIVGERAISS